MSQHHHGTRVPGCFRCELGEDEARFAQEEEDAEAARQKSDPGIRPGAEEKTGLTATPREFKAGCPVCGWKHSPDETHGPIEAPPFRLYEMGPKGTQRQTHTEKVYVYALLGDTTGKGRLEFRIDGRSVLMEEYVDWRCERLHALARRLAVALADMEKAWGDCREEPEALEQIKAALAAAKEAGLL